MKKTLIILAHPNIEQSIVNKTLIETIKDEENITLHDLYKEYSVVENLDVIKEQDLLVAHERIIFQFPLYWFSSPAMIKEWQDKVLEYGFAYGHDGTKLTDKECQIVITAGSPESAYCATGKNQYTLDEFLLPLRTSINFVGMKFTGLFVVGGALNITIDSLAQSAAEYKTFILNH